MRKNIWLMVVFVVGPLASVADAAEQSAKGRDPGSQARRVSVMEPTHLGDGGHIAQLWGLNRDPSLHLESFRCSDWQGIEFAETAQRSDSGIGCPAINDKVAIHQIGDLVYGIA